MKTKLLLLTVAGLTAGSATIGLTSCFGIGQQNKNYQSGLSYLNNEAKKIAHEGMLQMQSMYPEGVFTDEDIAKIEKDFPNDPAKWPIEALNKTMMPYSLNGLHEERKHMLNTHKNPIVDGVTTLSPKTMWRKSEHINPSNFWIFDNVGNIVGSDVSFITGHHLDSDSLSWPSILDNFTDDWLNNLHL